MLEYVISLAGLLVVGAVLCGLIGTTFRHGERTVNLVGSDYP